MPSVYPIVVQPRDFRGAFPNMAKRDEQVWRKFLAAHAERYLGFAYDVAVGGIITHQLDDDLPTRTAWQYKTALRIDVCAVTPDEVWVIEVKPEAQAGALGAVLAYTLVVEREQVFDRALRMAIVCEYCQPDIAWAAEVLGVVVVVV